MKSVTSRDGLRGEFDEDTYPLDGSQEKVPVQLENGQEVWMPWDTFQQQDDGSYSLPVDLQPWIQPDREASTTTFPVIEENLELHKRRTETGKVRITKRVYSREETVDEPLVQEHAEVERVPVNRELDEPASVRQEGDTLVIPIMEEVLVVEKRLMLKEEIRVTRRREEVRNPQTVNLKGEEVTVERLKANTPGEIESRDPSNPAE